MPFGITQSKASRHLATLRHAALVVDRKDGAWSYYSVRTPESDLERGLARDDADPELDALLAQSREVSREAEE